MSRLHSLNPSLDEHVLNEQVQQQADMITALCSYLLEHWEALPAPSRLPVDIGSVTPEEAQELILKRHTRILMEYAEMALKQALVLQHQRLSGHTMH